MGRRLRALGLVCGLAGGVLAMGAPAAEQGLAAVSAAGAGHRAPVGTFAPGGALRDPSAVAVGPNSRVYVVDTGADKVNVFAPSGQFLTRWGSFGSGLGEFDGPSGVALDAAGDVYIADTNNNRVQEFSPSGAYLA